MSNGLLKNCDRNGQMVSILAKIEYWWQTDKGCKIDYICKDVNKEYSNTSTRARLRAQLYGKIANFRILLCYTEYK